MTREIAVWLQQVKDVEYPNKVMVVAIEGLSNSGKSTLALNLVKELKESVCIEADLFHYGRSKTKLVYQEWIKKAKGGQAIPENRYPALQTRCHARYLERGGGSARRTNRTALDAGKTARLRQQARHAVRSLVWQKRWNSLVPLIAKTCHCDRRRHRRFRNYGTARCTRLAR